MEMLGLDSKKMSQQDISIDWRGCVIIASNNCSPALFREARQSETKKLTSDTRK